MLIDEEQYVQLIDSIDKFKPQKTSAYRLELLFRKNYCTIISGFLFYVMYSQYIALALTACIFVAERFINRNAYDQRMSNKDLANLMYKPDLQKKDGSTYIRFLLINIAAYTLLLLLHIVTAIQKGAMPPIIVQVLATTLFPLLALYSSKYAVQVRVKSRLFFTLKNYEDLGNLPTGANSPYADRVFSLIKNEKVAMAGHSFATILLYVFVGFGFYTLNVFWPIWPGAMPLWGIVVATSIPLFLALYSLTVIPLRLFKLHCYLIDQQRISQQISKPTYE